MSTAICSTCGEAHRDDAAHEGGWSTRFAEGGVSDDGERYRLNWWEPDREYVRKKALFRILTNSSTAVLLHIRTHRISQRVSKRIHDIDVDATLDDIPNKWLQRMRSQGFKLLTQVEA